MGRFQKKKAHMKSKLKTSSHPFLLQVKPTEESFELKEEETPDRRPLVSQGQSSLLLPAVVVVPSISGVSIIRAGFYRGRFV